jgi:hypothetical protein
MKIQFKSDVKEKRKGQHRQEIIINVIKRRQREVRESEPEANKDIGLPQDESRAGFDAICLIHTSGILVIFLEVPSSGFR